MKEADIRFEPEYGSRTRQYNKCFVNDQYVGMEYSEFPHNFLKESSTVYYYDQTPCRTKRGARDQSALPRKEPVYFTDEFWWDDDEIDDAYFPTFMTVEQLIAFHQKKQKPPIQLRPRVHP